MPNLSLLTEVLVAERELNETQRLIDHARKTIIGPLSPVRSYLNRRQLEVDVRRIRIDAAKQYLATTE